MRVGFAPGIGAVVLMAVSIAGAARGEGRAPDIRHVVVHAERDMFCGWPANNGAWSWDGREILVGFTRGRYEVSGGHHIASEGQHPWLARSMDGGETWKAYDPAGYAGDGGKPSPAANPIDFTAPGFAMRVVGTGYHTAGDPRGHFFVSSDRGRTWDGPWSFGALADEGPLRGMELTPRTDYRVVGGQSCLVFMGAKPKGKDGADRAFCARTSDGGRTWSFLSWVVPPSDPNRAVMPQTVGAKDGRLVVAMRRRQTPADVCWVDAYASGDGGQTWSFASRIGDTGRTNGNPPALARLADGRLCCVYGNRTTRRVVGRYSGDEGRTWGEEFVIRDDYFSGHDDQDFGYPRLVQRGDGRLVAIYYWASREHPQQHIAASIWSP